MLGLITNKYILIAIALLLVIGAIYFKGRADNEAKHVKAELKVTRQDLKTQEKMNEESSNNRTFDATVDRLRSGKF